MDKKLIRKMLGGLRSYFPNQVSYDSVGGAISSRYCYMEWLRILKILNNNNLETSPQQILELGTGNSVGFGMAAILTGSEFYNGLDIVNHLVDDQENLKIFDQLLNLFKNKSNPPAPNEFPDDYDKDQKTDRFPNQILTDERLKSCLNEDRIKMLKFNLENDLYSIQKNSNKNTKTIRYIHPWDEFSIKEKEIDFIFSIGVLQSVDDLKTCYRSFAKWIKNDGIMYHRIDFRNLGLFNEWNAHWKINDLQWKIIKGKRPYLINREPLSTHLELLKENGFEIVSVNSRKNYFEDQYTGSIQRNQLTKRFKNISKEDFETTYADILVKRQ